MDWQRPEKTNGKEWDRVDEKPFKDMIKENPEEWGPKLVFADFLEEQGECHRAATIRENYAIGEVPPLSEEQQVAVDQILQWRDAVNKPFITMGGLAGTGKTTVIKHLTNEWKYAAVATLSGKAVHVLRNKGVGQAQTIHSMMYIPFRTQEGLLAFSLKNELTAPNDQPINEIIIDEASMVNGKIYDDLLSFGIPIVFVGDHGQLEPIGRDTHLMKKPDVTLNTIHRQARDNPILRLAHAFREGRKVVHWEDKKHGRLDVTGPQRFWDQIHKCDVAICGFNQTRHKVNRLIRERKGINHNGPVVGERIICLRNNKEFSVFNGQLAVCEKVYKDRGRWIKLDIRLDDDRLITADCFREQFGRSIEPEERDNVPLEVLIFDYGYCLTAHKAQGSEASSVAVLDEVAKQWNGQRWRYTAATRARDRLVYCM